MPEDHCGARGGEGGRRVEVVAPEDPGHQSGGDVADHPPADRCDDAQQDRGGDAEPVVEGLDGPGGRPAPQHHSVGDDQQEPPRPGIHLPHHGDRCADEGDAEVVRVGERHRWAGFGAEEDIADHPAGQRGHDREDREPHRVEVPFPGDFPPEDPVEQDPHEVDGAEDLGKGGVEGVEHVHAPTLAARRARRCGTGGGPRHWIRRAAPPRPRGARPVPGTGPPLAAPGQSPEPGGRPLTPPSCRRRGRAGR